MKIAITTEKRGEIEAIQKRFRQHLSSDVILRSTSQAINETMRAAIKKTNKAIKAEYNINEKYLDRMAEVKPKSRPGSLYAGIHLRYKALPIVAFEHTASSSGVTVSIQKGSSRTFPNAFLATMKAGGTSSHTGIYGRGRYTKKIYGWKRASDLPEGKGKGRRYTKSMIYKKREAVTEIKTTSPFSMAMGKKVAPQVRTFIGQEVLRKTQRKLQRKVDKMTKG